MKTYIWSIPTRLFHWVLVVFTIVVFITTKKENLLTIHITFGYAIGVLIIFRIIWGFVGPKYSKFKDFPLSFKDTIQFIINIFSPKKRYLSHNPAASFIVVLIIVIFFLLTISGILTYGIQEGKGITSFLNSIFFKEMATFKSVHEILANTLLLLIAIHIIGVVSDYILHKKDGTLKSIFNGYKDIEGKSIVLNLLHKALAVTFFTFTIVVAILSLQKNSFLNKSKYKPIEYKKEAKYFVDECASCHILYPPHLLPSASWNKLMKNKSLQNHFGDDASLDEEIRVKINNYLVKNSAEYSTKEASIYILDSMQKKYDKIAITHTSYWKQKHKNITKYIFKSDKVKSKANCKACHSDIESGLLADNKIEIPKD